MDFRCSFTTSIQYVGESEHAETPCRRSDSNDFYGRCFEDLFIFSSIFDAERLQKIASVWGPSFAPFDPPKTMKNELKINENSSKSSPKRDAKFARILASLFIDFCRFWASPEVPFSAQFRQKWSAANLHIWVRRVFSRT